MTDDARTELADVLSEHALVSGIRDMRKHCACGWESERRVGLSAHRAHLADAILASGLIDRAVDAALGEVERRIESDPAVRLGHNVGIVCSCVRCETAHAAARIVAAFRAERGGE